METEKETIIRVMAQITDQPKGKNALETRRYRLIKSVSVVLLVVSLDQWSKDEFFSERAGGALNPGISFGLGSSIAGQEMNLLLLVFAVGIAYWQRKYFLKHPILAGLFFGGVASNILDRVVFGAVRDWLPVPGLQLYNNLADWAIFASWAAFLVFALKKQSSHEPHD